MDGAFATGFKAIVLGVMVFVGLSLAGIGQPMAIGAAATAFVLCLFGLFDRTVKLAAVCVFVYGLGVWGQMAPAAPELIALLQAPANRDRAAVDPAASPGDVDRGREAAASR